MEVDSYLGWKSRVVSEKAKNPVVHTDLEKLNLSRSKIDDGY